MEARLQELFDAVELADAAAVSRFIENAPEADINAVPLQ